MGKKTLKSCKFNANPFNRDSLAKLEQLPNVGPKIARILRRLGLKVPQDLKGRDPYQMYLELCQRHGTCDPCVLDVFISAVKFIDGGPAKPWWKFTAERKRRLKAEI